MTISTAPLESLIQQTKHPQGYLLSFTHPSVRAYIDYVCRLAPWHLIHYTETVFSIQHESGRPVAHVQFVLGTYCIHEECLYHVLSVHAPGIHYVHQVCIVHEQTGWFLGVVITLTIYHIHEAGITQELHIIHYCCS